MTWFINKINKKNCNLVPKYLSQEGYNMNPKSWKIQHDILTFFEEEEKKRKKKKRGFQISKFWVIGINMLILSCWPTHQYDNPILLDLTENHTNEVFQNFVWGFKKKKKKNWDINIKG